jgi:hypothetical protein
MLVLQDAEVIAFSQCAVENVAPARSPCGCLELFTCPHVVRVRMPFANRSCHDIPHPLPALFDQRAQAEVIEHGPGVDDGPG